MLLELAEAAILASASRMQQERYWNYLVQTVGQSRYLHYYREQSEAKERAISIFAAITSSSSIAGWAIWQQLSWVWACIIAASQVLTAIRKYLPYGRRAEVLRDATPAFKSLALRIESQWFKVAEGMLSEAEINDAIMLFAKEQQDIEDRIFSKVTLKTRNDLVAKAEQETQKYISTYYG